MPSPGLEKDWFRKHTPAQIIAKVNEFTLATVSTWTLEYLDHVGWTNNEIVDKIYYLHVTQGLWKARNDSNGSRLVNDQASTAGYLVDGSDTAAELLSAINVSCAALAACIDTNRIDVNTS